MLLVLFLLSLVIVGNSFTLSPLNMKKTIISGIVTVSILTNNDVVANAISRNGITYTTSSSGLSYYDYPGNKNANELTANKNSKVSIDIKGYLAGRNGWQFIDTIADDTTIRVDISNTPVIEGLKIGLIGNNNDIPPMHKGDKRRLIIPSRLGYKTMNDEPIPFNNDNKRRLYNTVFNNERGSREKEALGDSIVGEIILDVTLKRVKN